MSEFLPCTKRQKLVMFHADGTQGRVSRCAEQKAPKANQQVTPDDCAACPVRHEVMQHALQIEKYRPPGFEETHGHLIKSRRPDTNASDLWANCGKRELLQIQACCGTLEDIRLCKHLDCPRFGQDITPAICAACKFRQE